MAIGTGVAPHLAFISTVGGTFPIESGSVTQQGMRKSSSFSVAIPRNLPGATAVVASLQAPASIFVSGIAGAGTLITGMCDTADDDFVGGYIRITGRDNSAMLHNTKVSKKWQNQTGSSIVEELAGQAGLGASASASNSLMAGKKLYQDFVKMADNVSASSVINRLAEFDAAKWFVDPTGTLNYMDLGMVLGSYTVNVFSMSPLRGDFIRLNIRKNFGALSNSQVSVKSWHTKDKKSYDGQSNVGGGGSGGTAKYLVPHLDQAHAQQHAKARAKEMSRHLWNVNATVVGDPSVNAGMGLTVSGTPYDSMFEIDQIVHQFGMSGYTMTITAKSMESGGGG